MLPQQMMSQFQFRQMITSFVLYILSGLFTFLYPEKNINSQGCVHKSYYSIIQIFAPISVGLLLLSFTFTTIQFLWLCFGVFSYGEPHWCLLDVDVDVDLHVDVDLISTLMSTMCGVFLYGEPMSDSYIDSTLMSTWCRCRSTCRLDVDIVVYYVWCHIHI
jgi:hypothetical protein